MFLIKAIYWARNILPWIKVTFTKSHSLSLNPEPHTVRTENQPHKLPSDLHMQV